MTQQAAPVQAHHWTVFFVQKANVSVQSSAKGLFSLAVSLQTLQEVARPHGRKMEKKSTNTKHSAGTIPTFKTDHGPVVPCGFPGFKLQNSPAESATTSQRPPFSAAEMAEFIKIPSTPSAPSPYASSQTKQYQYLPFKLARCMSYQPVGMVALLFWT